MGMLSKKQVLDSAGILLGEMIATAILMYVGCMGCVKSPSYPNSHFQSAVNFGFVILICIQCFSVVSGAHINPSVTLAKYICKGISLPMALLYFVAQILGAIIGYGLLLASLPNNVVRSSDTPDGVCITVVAKDITLWQGLLIEFLLTCILVIVCCAVWDPRNAKFHDSVPIRFGLAVGCLALTAGQFTGASMNPARSFAPAVWNNVWEHHWIYWVGPLVASLLTSLLYKYVFCREPEEKEENTLAQ